MTVSLTGKIVERLDAIELHSAERFASFKSRIFWTPLLWAVISLGLWLLGTVLARP